MHRSGERELTLKQLAKLLDMTYKNTHSLASKGRVGVNGKRFFLETYRTTRGVSTTWEAYMRLLDKLNGVRCD
jgi:hypothetical protein